MLKENNIRMTVFLGTALVDMYAKCGEVHLGVEVFEGMKGKNVLVWTTMIKGLAMLGRGSDSLMLVSQRRAQVLSRMTLPSLARSVRAHALGWLTRVGSFSIPWSTTMVLNQR
uniref:Pentatricopeptide repeat-containing protein n=1 Tax=Aegilops tauschii subsp. strangulata TaxID=200361 RepID=A0A452ZCI3_AEGTS